MTTYNAISDTSLAQDKPFTQSIARQLRDNPLAIREGDSSAPKVEVLALNNGAYFATTPVSAGTLSSGVTVPYTTEVIDNNGWYNNATSRFTPLKAGLYLVTCSLVQGTGGTATNGLLRLIKNSGVYAGASIEAANVYMTPCTALVYMNGSTDYLYCDLQYSSGSFTYGGGGVSFFSAVLVGHS